MLKSLKLSLLCDRFSGSSGQAEGDGLCGHPAQTDAVSRSQPQRQVGKSPENPAPAELPNIIF